MVGLWSWFLWCMCFCVLSYVCVCVCVSKKNNWIKFKIKTSKFFLVLMLSFLALFSQYQRPILDRERDRENRADPIVFQWEVFFRVKKKIVAEREREKKTLKKKKTTIWKTLKKKPEEEQSLFVDECERVWLIFFLKNGANKPFSHKWHVHHSSFYMHDEKFLKFSLYM